MRKQWHRRTEHHNNGYYDGYYRMAFMRKLLPHGTSLTINAATTTGGDMAFMRKLRHRRTEHHNNGYDNGSLLKMAFMRYNLRQARLSRLTRPPRRAVIWHLCENIRHRRTEHHNNGYDDGTNG